MAPSRVESKFVRTRGKEWLDPEGRPFLLRGVGLGSWMLPEGYMWKFPKGADRPRRMEQKIQDWVGEAEAREFWARYYRQFITEADVLEIAAQGFNSLRVPLLGRFLLPGQNPGLSDEAAWSMLDDLIGWCRDAGVYVILDLHGAPGGQTGTNIDDSVNDQPELFTNPMYRAQTIDLWRRLARRYRDETIVAGYDLLNEPLPNWFSHLNDRVMPLYRDLIAAIREEDPHHTIILEGVHWATDWSIFTDMPDDNVVLQFHKYWNNPDTESLGPYLEARDRWNVPLFMGEGGENNTDWYVGAFRLFEDHHISWNFWTWKKMDTTNSPFSIRRPPGWDALIEAIEGDLPMPAPAARAILLQFTDNLKLAACDSHPEVARALFSRPPVRIPAAFFGFLGPEVSFHREGSGTDWDGFRRNDALALLMDRGSKTVPNFQHGGGQRWAEDEWIQVRFTRGDWAEYTFTLVTPASLRVIAQARTVVGPGRLGLTVAGSPIEVPLGRLGWETVIAELPSPLASGTHSIRVESRDCTFDLEWLELSLKP